MDALAEAGRVGRVKTIPDGLTPGSDVANMSLLGYDPAAHYTGRAPIEAAGMGIVLGKDETAFRCNLVQIEGGRMADYSTGSIETPVARALIEELQPVLSTGTVRLFPGVSYRHLLVIKGFPRGSLVCTPPHDITGRGIESYLPSGPGSEILRGLMERARGVLAGSPVNARRVAEGKPRATDIWLWGHGVATVLPALGERFGLTGAVISAVDLVRGLGRMAGMEVLTVRGATGYLDTNYAGKVRAAEEALETKDLVYLHVEAPDETSHEGSLEKKLQAIEDFDARVVGELARIAKRRGDLRLLVLPDHATLLSTKTHDATPVPFVACGPGIPRSASKTYCERAASEAPVVTGPELFKEFLRGNLARM
jgi:2,3-bisphosphoglycerate-independent phosphoglycerate mutase